MSWGHTRNLSGAALRVRAAMLVSVASGALLPMEEKHPTNASTSAFGAVMVVGGVVLVVLVLVVNGGGGGGRRC